MKKTNILSHSLHFISLFLFLSLSYGCSAQSSNEHTGQVKAPETGLHEAIISGDLETVLRHIAAGSDLNEKDPFGGSTPLIAASVFGKTEIAKALIDAGADVNLKNSEGSTALHSAAFFCRVQIVQALLDTGADKTIRNSYGSTAHESVVVPFNDVESIYELMQQQLGGMGLTLDMKRMEKTRPEIAKLLQ